MIFYNLEPDVIWDRAPKGGKKVFGKCNRCRGTLGTDTCRSEAVVSGEGVNECDLKNSLSNTVRTSIV